MRLSRSIEINRPAPVVWQWYAVDHVTNHPRWDPAMELRQDQQGPIGVGTRIHRRNTRAGFPIDGTMDIVEFDAERSMGALIRDQTPGGLLEVRSRASVESVDPATSRLTFELELPGEAPSMQPSMIDASLARIKELIEEET